MGSGQKQAENVKDIAVIQGKDDVLDRIAELMLRKVVRFRMCV